MHGSKINFTEIRRLITRNILCLKETFFWTNDAFDPNNLANASNVPMYSQNMSQSKLVFVLAIIIVNNPGSTEQLIHANCCIKCFIRTIISDCGSQSISKIIIKLLQWY